MHEQYTGYTTVGSVFVEAVLWVTSSAVKIVLVVVHQPGAGGRVLSPPNSWKISMGQMT